MEMGNLMLARKKLTNEALEERFSSVFLLEEELECSTGLLFGVPLPKSGTAPDPHQISDQRSKKVYFNISASKARRRDILLALSVAASLSDILIDFRTVNLFVPLD